MSESSSLYSAAVEELVVTAGGARCSCGGSSPDGKLTLNGKSVSINGLPLIFEHLQKKGLRPGNGCAETLLAKVRVYHPIEPGEESAYRDALAVAYQTFCERRANGQQVGTVAGGN